MEAEERSQASAFSYDAECHYENNSYGGENYDYYSDENWSRSEDGEEYTGAAAMTLAEELMELQNANNRELAEEGADDAGLAFEIDNVDEGTSAQISNNM